MSELNKTELYESVKLLVESPHPHILLNQHKLFTLFSIAFQYMLYNSTKGAGAYIIRIEDCVLADKLAKKSKDPSTRKFMQTLLIPRKLAYGKSTFYLDFFNVASWNMTKDLPKDKIKGAILVKNSSSRPMNESPEIEGEEVESSLNQLYPKDFYFTSLRDIAPKTITIAFDEAFELTQVVSFPFIKKEVPRSISGVTLGKDMDWENID